MSNIKLAFHNASKGKAHYTEVKAIKENPSQKLKIIQQLLIEKTFRNAEYIEFKRKQYGKVRNIFKLPFFPDRIIQHAVCQVLEAIWDAQYIRDTYSCIKGRGIHDGVVRLKKALRNNREATPYCLKLDIQKYYPSVNNNLMKQCLRRKIKCKDTLWLLDHIIDSTKGLPIGNYTSQHFANLYLSSFDHYAKEHLKVRHYFRYCDDIVILAADKNYLHTIYNNIEGYLKGKLKLTVKSNRQIFPVKARGIDFLGYRFFHDYTLLRKRIAQAFKRRMREVLKHEDPLNSSSVRSTIASYKGWMKYANCNNLKDKYELDKAVQRLRTGTNIP